MATATPSASPLALLLLVVLQLAPSPAPPAPTTNNGFTRVIVVGAGPAGIATAARLMENNFTDVIILEAEDRIGGRVHSIQWDGRLIEQGAEWVHGEDNVVFNMAEPLGLLDRTNKDAYDNASFVRRGGYTADEELMQSLRDTFLSMYVMSDGLRSYNGSAGEWFENQFKEHFSKEVRTPTPSPEQLDAFLGWVRKAEAFEMGTEWTNVCPRSDWEGSKGNQDVTWRRNGYRSILDLLMKRIPDATKEIPVEENIVFNSEVAAIHYGDRMQGGHQFPRPAVVVELADGSRHLADMVIVTVSLGVLKASANTMFDPPLPEKKMNAIRTMGFGQVDKVFLRFAEPWWPKGLTGFNFLATPEDLAAFKQKHPELSAKGDWVHGFYGFYVDQHEPSTVLMGVLADQPARNMELYSDEEVKQGLMAILDMYLGQNHTIPEPVGFLRSKWYTNPHFRGSYSFRSLDAERAGAGHADLETPILDPQGRPVVMFAGEATNRRHYATVHGAIESGWREADRVLSSA